MKRFPLILALGLTLSCQSQSHEETGKSDERRADNVTEQQSDSISYLNLLFVGDIMQHQAQIDGAKTDKGYDYTACFSAVKPLIEKADWAIGNLEVTFGGKPYQGYPTFSAPDELLSTLSDVGFDVLITANNHCLDMGKKGLERTIHLLDSAGIKRAGTYLNSELRSREYPLILEKNDIRVAILNYTYGTNEIPVTAPNIVNYIDTTLIKQDIMKSKALDSDVIIACMHWGIEYKRMPNNDQKQLAEWLLKKGADHVIGSHPHVIQPLELRTDSLNGQKHVVLYSLGNMVSNMSAPHTEIGMLFTLKLKKEKGTISVDDTYYDLVWTDRPTLSKKKGHRLYPVTIPTDSLTADSKYRLSTYTEHARTLLKEQFGGIKEREKHTDEKK